MSALLSWDRIIGTQSWGRSNCPSGFAAILASILNCTCGLTLRQAADAVREHWKEWLDLLVKVEDWAEHHPYDPQLFFAVAWLFAPAGMTHRIVMGGADDIATALAGESVYACNFVSIALVRHHLYANAALAGITLPKRLTIGPADAHAYAKWRAEIDLYREAAGARAARKLVKA